MSEQTKRITKNIAILLLTCSLLVLTVVTWFGRIQPGNAQRRQAVGDLLGGFFWQDDSASELYVSYEEYEYTMRVLSPVQAAVRNSDGMSLLTDREQVREVFERSATILTGVFDTAAEPEPLSQRAWRTALTGRHFFFDFVGELPLEVLAAVLDTQTEPFVGYSARYLVISTGNDGVQLLWKAADGQAYASKTAVTAGDMAALLTEYGAGEARYAFEVTGFTHLPDEMITVPQRTAPVIYMPMSLVSENTSVTGERMIQTVLTGFGYIPYATGGYLEPDHTRVYVEELNTLRISVDGKLSFLSSDREEQQAAVDADTYQKIISSSASLLDRVLTDVIGDVTLYLQELTYEEEIGRVIVSFGCAADGIPLVLDDGYFARLEYEGEDLVAAYLTLQSFLRLQQEKPILPDEQAAAVTAEDCAVFELRYTKNRNGEYHAGWYYLLDESRN